MKTTGILLTKRIHTELYPKKEVQADSNIFDLYIDDINKVYPECSELLIKLQASEQQIKFFKTDKEMRIKFPDIWQMQLDQEELQLKDLTQKLIDFGIKNQLDIAGFIGVIADERNNFNDLFKRQEI